MRITILGAGAFGSALETVLTANDPTHEISFYDPLKFPDVKLETVTNPAEVLVLAVPSKFAPELLEQIPDKNKPLINTSKGFLSLRPFESFPNFSLLSGGAFAENLVEKQPAVLVATSDLAENLFKTDWLKIERSSDAFGILLCGTFKNIYAIGSGYKKLKPNSAPFREFIDRALAELKFILAANNCDPATADLACGKLDLVMTCASEKSRNYQFGDQLSRRNHVDKSDVKNTTEGLSAAEKLAEILNSKTPDLKLPENCPLLREILERIADATQ